MEKLPDNWNTMTQEEKSVFFFRYYIDYTREGEYEGIYDWAPQEIKDAYQAFLQEKKA